jgi:hypothetical protein
MGAPATSVNVIKSAEEFGRLNISFQDAADLLAIADKQGGSIDIPNCVGGTPWKEDHRPNHAARVSSGVLKNYLKLQK